MKAKTVIRTGVVVALIGIAGVLLEKIVWQTADTYPALLAGQDSDDIYDNADVAFKKNGTFVRCMNHPVSRVYKVIYTAPRKS